MQSSAEAAMPFAADAQNTKAGAAFFLSSMQVATECAADGAPITFHELRSWI
jgi:hypothetical protein